MDIGLALIALAAGLTLMFGGYRLARIIIPIWGFVTGLAFGGAIISAFPNAPGIGLALGLLTGLMTGVALAALSYFFFSAAVVILFATLGYWVGSNFVLLLGGSFNLLSALIGIGLGIIGGLVAMAFNAPKYLLIAGTALAGSVTTIAGILLLTNQVQASSLDYGTVQPAINNSVIWTLAAVILAVAGYIIQTLSASRYVLKDWTVRSPTHEHLPPAAPKTHY